MGMYTKQISTLKAAEIVTLRGGSSDRRESTTSRPKSGDRRESTSSRPKSGDRRQSTSRSRSGSRSHSRGRAPDEEGSAERLRTPKSRSLSIDEENVSNVDDSTTSVNKDISGGSGGSRQKTPKDKNSSESGSTVENKLPKL